MKILGTRILKHMFLKIFNFAKKKFIKRIDYPSDYWQKLKSDTLFGQLPILEINENNGAIVKLAQSNTIARFLARRFNLAGKTDIEQARAEMILDYFTDLHSLFQQAYYVDNEQVKLEKMKIFSQEQFPHHISLLEKLLEQQNSQYLVGDELTGIERL
jgi:prostaglandin-H2 D-isomerase / glutathione transferase